MGLDYQMTSFGIVRTYNKNINYLLNTLLKIHTIQNIFLTYNKSNVVYLIPSFYLYYHVGLKYS